MNADVSIVRCEEYEGDQVRRALAEAIEAVGGLDWVRPGMVVALKANLVAAQKPEKAATTHPVVLAELTHLLRERGARVIIGDSPGGLYNAAALQRVYNAAGLELAVQAGAELNNDFSEQSVAAPELAVMKTFDCTAWLKKADAIINVCKLKSHGMMGMSAAAKNMFGTIPGTKKPEYHFRFPDMRDFSNMILDLDEYFKPILNIADAVVGMEGNGPTQGKPRKIGAILASHSPHSLDLAAASILGFRPQEIPTLVSAQQRGLIPSAAEELTIYGCLQDFTVSDFDKIDTRNDLTFKGAAGGGALGNLFGSVARSILSSRPEVSAKECVGCAMCARICPAKAITMKNKLPEINRDQCIHCFCCQEFCPKGAMKVKRTWLARILTK